MIIPRTNYSFMQGFSSGLRWRYCTWPGAAWPCSGLFPGRARARSSWRSRDMASLPWKWPHSKRAKAGVGSAHSRMACRLSTHLGSCGICCPAHLPPPLQPGPAPISQIFCMLPSSSCTLLQLCLFCSVGWLWF